MATQKLNGVTPEWTDSEPLAKVITTKSADHSTDKLSETFKLCYFCRNIPEAFCARQVLSYDHQPSRTAFKQSAADGCPMCRELIALTHFPDALDRVPPEGGAYGQLVLRWNTLIPTGASNQKSIYLVDRGTGSAIIQVELYPVPEQWEQNQVPETDIDIIQSWLDNCHKTHLKCARKSNYVPTRLIDVGPPSGVQTPRIVLTALNPSFLEGSNEYIALSYCWGKTMPEEIKTKTENLSARCGAEGIPVLPKTLSDAVNVTRRMGVQYLWIDALCILQNSADDWLVEAGKMGLVYANAYCTIAAASSSNTSTGFLPLKSPPGLRADKTLIGPNCGFQRLEQRYCLSRVPKYRQEWSELPLQTRAWTLQEQHLSRRIVYYSGTHLMWECNCAQTSNDLPWTVVSDPRGYQRLFDGSMIESRVADRWYKIVEEYSTRDLTFPSDKLAAISGLASAVQGMMKSRYLAGLWEENFPSRWCWHSGSQLGRKFERNHTRATEYRAPSWSWASINGPVLFGSSWSTAFAKPDCMRLLHVNYELWSSDATTGKIKSASIVINGLWRIAYTHQAFFSKTDTLQKQCYNTELFDGPGSENCIGTMTMDIGRASEIPSWAEIYCVRVAAKVLSPYMSSEMPLRMQNSVLSGPNRNDAALAMLKPTALALALVPTGNSDGELKEFRRVGLIHYMLESAFEGWGEEIFVVV